MLWNGASCCAGGCADGAARGCLAEGAVCGRDDGVGSCEAAGARAGEESTAGAMCGKAAAAGLCPVAWAAATAAVEGFAAAAAAGAAGGGLALAGMKGRRGGGSSMMTLLERFAACCEPV